MYIPFMKRVKVTAKTRIVITGVEGFFRRTVTPFGNGAKVDCPKEYLGRGVFLVITKTKA